MRRINSIKLVTVIAAVAAIYLSYDIINGVSQYNRGTTYLAEGQYDKSIACFYKFLEREDEFPEAYCNRGTAHYEARRYDEAIRDFDKAIELNPEFSEAYYNRAMVYYHKMQYDSARRDFKKAQSLGHYVSPDVFEALNEYSDADRQSKN